MKNKEQYLTEILESFANNTDNCSFRKNYILKKSRCNGISCKECSNMVKEWFEDEYQEPIKLTDDEIIILKNIDKRWKWIARDELGGLYVFENKPTKCFSTWDYTNANTICQLFNSNIFKFVKWEDKEPYSIDDLLKQNGVER